MDMKATPAANTLALDNGTLDGLALSYRFTAELDAARAAADDPDNYYDLLPHLSGLAALATLEAVEDDIVSAMAIITVMITEKWMLPCIAADHPLRPIAVALVESYKAWAVDNESYVGYSSAAWAFKYEYDTARHFGHLCGALPSQGVDEEVAQGPRPAVRWTSFGNYLMQIDPIGHEIDALWDELIAAEPPDAEADDLDASDWSDWCMDVCTARRNARLAELMKPYDEMMRLTIFCALKGTLER